MTEKVSPLPCVVLCLRPYLGDGTDGTVEPAQCSGTPSWRLALFHTRRNRTMRGINPERRAVAIAVATLPLVQSLQTMRMM